MRRSASSATAPSVTTTLGSINYIWRRRNSEQFETSRLVGLRFAPEAPRGLQSTALVMKIEARVKLIESRKRAKLRPD